MSAGGRRPLWICRSVSGGGCRWPVDGGFRFAAHRAAQYVGSRPTASSFLACPRKEPKKGTRGCAPATPAPPPVGLRPKSAAPRPWMSGRVYGIPSAAAPRAQCLCPRVSGAVPKVHSGRHGRFCVARSAHGEAENCAALPRTRAERANTRNGRCFPPRVLASLPTAVVGRSGTSLLPAAGWTRAAGGFSRGASFAPPSSSSEPPLSALLPPTSWARKKSARPPGRVPAIPAAEGGTSGAPRRGTKKASPGESRQTQNHPRDGPGSSKKRPPGRAAASSPSRDAPAAKRRATPEPKVLKGF